MTKTLPKLKAELQIIFNEYIRLRDNSKPCISCGQIKPLQAGHFFTVRQYDGLRFNEDNCHGECSYCNLFDGMHLLNYDTNLPSRIGKENYEKLKWNAAFYKCYGNRWSRSELNDLIKLYKEKIKELKNS